MCGLYVWYVWSLPNSNHKNIMSALLIVSSTRSLTDAIFMQSRNILVAAMQLDPSGTKVFMNDRLYASYVEENSTQVTWRKTETEI